MTTEYKYSLSGGLFDTASQYCNQRTKKFEGQKETVTMHLNTTVRSIVPNTPPGEIEVSIQQFVPSGENTVY
jgi:hypothetical protein